MFEPSVKSLLSLLSLKDCHVGQSSPRNDDTPSEAPTNHPKKVQFLIKFALLGKYYYICGLIIPREQKDYNNERI